MTRGLGTLAAALTLATASPAVAHHSHPLTYDWCKSVESVEFKNPHSILVVKQDDGTAYTVDWMPVSGLTRSGILESAKGALAFGTRVLRSDRSACPATIPVSAPGPVARRLWDPAVFG